ncbi:MAG: DUF349 domain-containing protein [Actinobacteria bacterium]|nr:DUF349 domain-containing protein [Actinomycetota bacterium]
MMDEQTLEGGEGTAEPTRTAGTDEHTPAAEAPAPLPPLPSQVGRSKPGEPGLRPPRAAGPSPSEKFGRIDSDGNVFVTLPDGNEQFVGQWAAGSAEDGLRMFARRFDDLVVDVDLAGQRMAEGKLSPDEAQRTVERVRAALLDPKFVGDLAGLADRVHQLEILINVRRETLVEEREAARQAATARREAIVTEAEGLASSTDWRKTTEKFRSLVDEWKTIPRFDRASEQELWQRISAARSSFDKARRTHFSALDKQHAAAKAAKEKLVAEAEAMADSQDWNATSRAYRELMDRWKKAGFAGKPDDDKLWHAFRKAQDTFFNARKAALDSRDQEWQRNLEAKREVIAKAEALLPVRDHKAARREFRHLQSSYAAIGHVPRADKPKLDARLHKVDEAIKSAEQEQWRKSDPERSARAQMMVGLYEQSVRKLKDQLEQVRAQGGDTAAVESELQAQEELLAAARKYA